MTHYDAIILGGGPAGMSSLLWCHSLNLRAVLLEEAAELGGQMLQMFHPTFDYLGLMTANGRELRDHFVNQLDELKLDWRTCCRLDAIHLSERNLLCNGHLFASKAMILATGARKRTLDIPGEARLAIRGVSFTATRDHSLYAGKKVCVIGGGDSAVQNSLILARVCPHVTLLHRSEHFRARNEWLQEAQNHPRITILTNSEAIAIEGENRVERLQVVHNGQSQSIETEGVFIRVGMTPNTKAFRGQIELDEDGYITTDAHQRTSLPNVYAVGDVCRPICLSIATAVGHGAIAAKDISLCKLSDTESGTDRSLFRT